MADKFDPKKAAEEDLKRIIDKNSAPKSAVIGVANSRDLNRCARASEKIRAQHLNSRRGKKSAIKSAKGTETVLRQIPKRTDHALKKGWLRSSEDIVEFVENYVKRKCRLIFADAIEKREKERLDASLNDD